MSTVTYQAWMVVIPRRKGAPQRTIGFPYQKPEEVWDIALLWPTPKEVEKAKKDGAYETLATISYEEKPDAPV